MALEFGYGIVTFISSPLYVTNTLHGAAGACVAKLPRHI